MKRHQLSLLILFIMLLNACATYKPYYKQNLTSVFPAEKDLEHSFYIIGDAGNSSMDSVSLALQEFKKQLDKASKSSTALFLGDNIYEVGMPKKDDPTRKLAERRLDAQIETVKNFSGRTIFIPGNHDWYSGVEGVRRQEKYVEKALGKDSFLPENGCPIEKVKITDEIVLLILDSQWYITNWDKHPTINDDCEINSRELFFEEVESQIKKARGKTTIIAVHNPMFTNGNHGGQYTFKSHLKPVPILGSLKNLIRKTTGIANVDDQNKLYTEFKNRLITLSQENDKVIFVSGHDHNLQYIHQDNVRQIVSGSGSKLTPTRLAKGQFSYATPGFVRLDVFKDGSNYIRIYSASEKKIVFETEVLPADKLKTIDYNATFPKAQKASIYTKSQTDKSGFYKLLWGERYRDYYSTEVNAPTVNLDTLFGGLKPVRKGGGHQSKSLRLEAENGKQYVMRALRKNAVQYLQSVVFKDQYIEGQFDNTKTENLLMDVFTGAHPYAPFTIATLSDAVDVLHTNPVLYFVPKQKALGEFNGEFGDELYMIEEHPSDNHGNLASFAFSDELISTYDMLQELREDEENVVDEAAYIRARLFDMLVGDWDRHQDQWRWAKTKQGKKTVFKPVPRDRDQAFSKMSDGLMMDLANILVPTSKLMESFDSDLKNVKWFNLEPYPLDVALMSQSDKLVWDEEAAFIKSNLTDEVIDSAFNQMPNEVKDETIAIIKQKLKERRANLQKISDAYFKIVNKIVVVKGTDKDDWFDVERLPNSTKITGYRIKKGAKADVIFQREFNPKYTKEIWVYGLDDDDVFKVYGDGNAQIKVRLIGGQNNDLYDIINDKQVVVYDYKSKKNTFKNKPNRLRLSDDYETNVYSFKKPKFDVNQLLPSLGANPDDGFRLGVVNKYITYGFERNPFTSQHIFAAQYYFATNGFDLMYEGEFANVFGNWNLGFQARYTSPNYSINFFGFGNETINPNAENDSRFTMDYNRVKLSTLRFSPSIIWKGTHGGNFKIGVDYESIEVEETNDRFVNTFYLENGEESENAFLGAQAHYKFRNKDNEAFPTLGMEFDFKTGYKHNLEKPKGFGYATSSLVFDHKLIPSGQLVLATKVEGQIILGDDFEFFQASNLGANNGLRGFRDQRFTGKHAFYQSTDLRWKAKSMKTNLLPLNLGLYAGADYGRVWIDNDDSDKWNNSFGGGLFISGANQFTGNLSAFNSKDGWRLAFRLGFGF